MDQIVWNAVCRAGRCGLEHCSVIARDAHHHAPPVEPDERDLHGCIVTRNRGGLLKNESKAMGMRLVLNVIWLVLAGFWLAVSYLFAAVLLAITIIGLPFAKQSVKLAGYAFWPFGRTLIQSPGRSKSLSVIGNILWFVLAGWWLALEHLIAGALLCLTIIGIPLGVGSFKMASAALAPFGREVVKNSELVPSASSITIGA
jgi:uncharacterized membrane protein YccF (DUF307 family)